MLPVLTYTAPHARPPTRCAGASSTLDLARERAQTLGLRGAAFPWRTIRGEECSSYWPAGTAAFHINADIADAVIRYLAATDDEEFERETGLELLVETARLWRSLGHHDADGQVPHRRRHRARRVQRGRRQQRLHEPDGAAESARRGRRGRAPPDRAAELGVDDEEIAGWRDAARAMVVVYDETLGVHPQAEGFTSHQAWDFEATAARAVPAAAALPLLRPVPQAGRQAGRPGAGAVLVRGRVHARGEGPQLRLLRAADRARLVAVGVHPGGRSRPRSATSTWPTTTSPRRR